MLAHAIIAHIHLARGGAQLPVQPSGLAIDTEPSLYDFIMSVAPDSLAANVTLNVVKVSHSLTLLFHSITATFREVSGVSHPHDVQVIV